MVHKAVRKVNLILLFRDSQEETGNPFNQNRLRLPSIRSPYLNKLIAHDASSTVLMTCLVLVEFFIYCIFFPNFYRSFIKLFNTCACIFLIFYPTEIIPRGICKTYKSIIQVKQERKISYKIVKEKLKSCANYSKTLGGQKLTLQKWDHDNK